MNTEGKYTKNPWSSSVIGAAQPFSALWSPFFPDRPYAHAPCQSLPSKSLIYHRAASSAGTDRRNLHGLYQIHGYCVCHLTVARRSSGEIAKIYAGTLSPSASRTNKFNTASPSYLSKANLPLFSRLFFRKQPLQDFFHIKYTKTKRKRSPFCKFDMSLKRFWIQHPTQEIHR